MNQDEQHRIHVEQQIREQAAGIAMLEGISIEDAMKRIRTGHSDETSPVHPSYPASVAFTPDHPYTPPEKR